MKHLALISISVLLICGNAEARPRRVPLFDADAFRAELDETNLDEKTKDQLYEAYVDYDMASSKLNELMELNGLNKVKPAPKTITGDVTDPTIKAILKQVQKTHNRFETLKRTINKWGPSTNLTARASGASFQDKLNNERDIAKWTRKIWKAKLKAEKHDKKIYENWVKDTEKARDKSSDEWKPFFQGQLDQAAAAREEDPQICDTDM